MQILRLRMKMKQSQYKELLSKLGEVLSVLPDTIPMADKDLMEQKILDKKHQIEYDSATHGGSQKLHEHFLEHRDMKLSLIHI